MGDPKRLLSTFAAAALLAFGATACGGDDSDPAATQPASEEREKRESSGATGSSGGTGSDGKANDAKRGGGEEGDGRDSGASEFVPKEHEDSGGGSKQFRVKGGDNSIQEFGEEADDSERNEAATALHNFLDARAAEDWQSACSFLSAEIRKSLEELVGSAKQAEAAGCAQILEKLTNRAALPVLRAEAAKADVGSLRLEGDRAFVLYRGLGDTIMAIPMANEDGSWKVASIAGTPLN